MKNNTAVTQSLKNGAPQGDYIGMPPVYRQASPMRWVKVRSGVPFVRRERAQ